MKKLGFGTMRLPLLDAEDPTSIDLKQYEQMADLFIARALQDDYMAILLRKAVSSGRTVASSWQPRQIY